MNLGAISSMIGSSGGSGGAGLNGSNATGFAGGVMDLVGQGIAGLVKMAELPSTESYHEDINDMYSRYTNSDSMDDLQSFYDSTQLLKTDFTKKDLLGMSNGAAAMNIIGDAFTQGNKGAELGSNFGPWGSLIGMGIGHTQGAVMSGLGWYFRKRRANKEAQTLNREGTRANNAFLTSFNNSVNNAMLNKRNQSLLNLAAFGGPLDTTFTNGVRFITEGGSHSQNPLGGVPQGIASDGIPNLVEEGEIIYNDYVYSKRLKVPQVDKESLGLKKDKEYTYADAAKQIQKESEERPNDPISKRNLAEMMSRLQGSQETLKEKKDSQAFKKVINKMTPDELAMFIQQMQQPQQMQPMMAMQSMQPMQPTQSEVPMFAKGGLLGHKHAKDGNLNTFNFFDPTGPYRSQLYKGWEPGIELDENGQPIYDIVGEWSYTRPEDIGEGKGIITRTDENGRAQYAILDRDPRDYGEALRYTPLYDKKGKEIGGNYKIVPRELPETNNKQGNNNKNFSVAQALRTAPVWGSFATTIASLFDKPNYSNIARAERAMANVPRVAAGSVGQRLAYNPVDINYIANAMNNQAIGTRRAIMEGSLGNAAAAAGQLAALNYTSQTALGNALMQAARENDAKRAQVAAFNRETDSTNIGNALQAALANQQRDMAAAEFLFRTGQLRDAELGRVQANRSANLTNLFNNLGNLGQDMLNREQAAAMAQSYGIPYNPYMDTAGNTAFGYRWVPNPNRQSKGGKLNTKKGGKDA